MVSSTVTKKLRNFVSSNDTRTAKSKIILYKLCAVLAMEYSINEGMQYYEGLLSVSGRVCSISNEHYPLLFDLLH